MERLSRSSPASALAAGPVLGLLAAIRRYPALPVPQALPVGDYRAVLLGPPWFRRLAAIGLAVGGLPRWHGKRFRAEGSGVNLLRSAGDDGPHVEHLTMQLSLAVSPHDGRAVARVGYDASARFPWPAVVDELRRFDDGSGVETWLGMARTDWRWTRRLGWLRLPFMLIRDA